MGDQRADLRFEDVRSLLVTLYRRGVLVPFIGSGMSRRTCTSWEDFVRKLANEAGIAQQKVKSLSEDQQNVEAWKHLRLADTTVSALRPLQHDERAHKFRTALRAWKPHEGLDVPIPPQTKALAGLSWPLVLTTNYDDLYWSAAHASTRPVVLGRHLEDCHRVLRSLDETQPPILWALQGFLGGQAAKPEEVIEDPIKRRKLANQLVVGHQQYQRAINAEGHFRRAFAEVFRRRSLLFMGSGLVEDYFVNLFGEIIYHYGPGPYSHVAFLDLEKREHIEPQFLQTRLGIVPVFYDNHDCLPDYLSQLSTLVEPPVKPVPQKAETPNRPLAPVVHPDEMGFTIVTGVSGSDEKRVRVRVRNAGLPLPDPGPCGCSVISVGRYNNVPKEPDGEYAGQYLEQAKEVLGTQHGWKPLDDKECAYAFRYGHTWLFAVAARSCGLQTRKHDSRHLDVIPTAVCTLLSKIDAADAGDFNVVHMGAIASRIKKRMWHPIHPFAQTLRGIRRFVTRNQVNNIESINLYVVDPAVWDTILSGRISIAAFLSSDLETHRVELTDEEGNTKGFAVTVKESPKLDELLKQCNVDLDAWNVEISPHPTDKKESGKPAGEIRIAPTMTIVLTPRNAR